MIELLIVIAGATTAGGWGSLAWWTSTRHHDRRAVVLASRTVGCHPHGPKSAVRATWRTREGDRTRVIEGEIVAETVAAPSPRTGTRTARGGRVCHGVVMLHEDGSTTCHGGLDTCWGSGEHRAAPVACRSLPEGCGQCLPVGGAS